MDHSLRLTLVDAGRRDDAAAAWNDLEQAARPGLAVTWDWTGTWLEHYGDVVPHSFAIAWRHGRPRGAALITRGVARRRGRIPLRTLHLGTSGEAPGDGVFVEYNRLLAAPGDHAAFASALLAHLRTRTSWDELALDGFAPDDAQVLLRADPSLVPRREVVHAVDLAAAATAGDGDVVRGLAAGVQRRLRRGVRGLADPQTEWATDADHALDVLAELSWLHTRRWNAAGQRGAFTSPRFAAFHRALVPRLVARDTAILFRLRDRGRTLACLYCLVDRGRVLSYQSGVAQLSDNKVRPGLLAHALCMRACHERGLAEYDFLAGDGRYKRELATVTRELVWVAARRRTARTLLSGALCRGKALALRGARA